MTRDLQIGDQVLLRKTAWDGPRRRLWTVTIGQAENRLEGYPDFVQIRHRGNGIVIHRSARADEVRLFRSVEAQVAEKLMGDA